MYRREEIRWTVHGQVQKRRNKVYCRHVQKRRTKVYGGQSGHEKKRRNKVYRAWTCTEEKK